MQTAQGKEGAQADINERLIMFLYSCYFLAVSSVLSQHYNSRITLHIFCHNVERTH